MWCAHAGGGQGCCAHTGMMGMPRMWSNPNAFPASHLLRNASPACHLFHNASPASHLLPIASPPPTFYAMHPRKCTVNMNTWTLTFGVMHPRFANTCATHMELLLLHMLQVRPRTTARVHMSTCPAGGCTVAEACMLPLRGTHIIVDVRASSRKLSKLHW